MANVKEMFSDMIEEAVKSAKMISDPGDKACAYANIASALAQTGMVSSETISADITEKKTAKHSDKMKKQPKTIEPKEEKAEVKEAPKKAAPKKPTEWTEEWTEEAVEHFSKQLEYLSSFSEKYGEAEAESALNECLEDFSSGSLHNVADDVNPLNIVAFTAYVSQLMSADEESASSEG